MIGLSFFSKEVRMVGGLGTATSHASVARAEALRLIAGNELEVSQQRPAIIAYPTHIKGKLVVTGYAETGTRLSLNGKPISFDKDGGFSTHVPEDQLSEGLRWAATMGSSRKTWVWEGLR